MRNGGLCLAHGLKRAGIDVRIFERDRTRRDGLQGYRVGIPDTLGRALEARLRTEGVDCRFLRTTAKATPLAMVDVDAAGVPRYAFHGLDRVLFHRDPGAVNSLWQSIRGVHVGSIPIVSRQSSAMLLELIKGVPQRVITSFDPNVRLAFEPDVERWRTAVEAFREHSNLIKVSEEDLAALFGPSVDVDGVAARWLSDGCSLVVVTRGSAGASLFSSRAGQVDIPAVKVVVADTVGAGDSFQAAMLAWLEAHTIEFGPAWVRSTKTLNYRHVPATRDS